MRFNPLIVITLVLITGLSGCASQHENIERHHVPTVRFPSPQEPIS